ASMSFIYSLTLQNLVWQDVVRVLVLLSWKVLKQSMCYNNRSTMTDIQKDVKNAGQNLEAKAETAKDHAEGKPSSETLNKAKIKGDDVVQDVKRDL
ncbi:MAG: hypothetical protein ACJ70Q_07600, partial [Nitrososphaera sp.]